MKPPSKKFRDAIEFHCTDLRAAEAEFEVSLADMFGSDTILFDDGDDAIETTADLHQAIGFVRGAAMLLRAKPLALVESYGEPYDGDPVFIEPPAPRRCRGRA